MSTITWYCQFLAQEIMGGGGTKMAWFDNLKVKQSS